MDKNDPAVNLLSTIRGKNKGGSGNTGEIDGLRIVTVDTTEPDPITLIFEGKKLPLDIDIFEVPVACYPLRKGDRLLAFPLVGQDASQRWGVLQKINGGVVMATMSGATSLKIDGITKEYGAADLVIPPFFAVSKEQSKFTDSEGLVSDNYLRGDDKVIRPLKAGDKVSIAPTWDAAGEKVKYVILNRY